MDVVSDGSLSITPLPNNGILTEQSQFTSCCAMSFSLSNSLKSNYATELPKYPTEQTIMIRSGYEAEKAINLSQNIMSESPPFSEITSTIHSLPPNFVNRSANATGSNSVEMSTDRTIYGVLICVSGCACIFMLYMSIFGRRMKYTALRWHVLNCGFWGLLHLAHYASFAEAAPWPKYIEVAEWENAKVQVECFTRSVFPAGMFFIYIESILLTCSPGLAKNWIFCFVFGFFIIPVLNGLMIFCFFAEWMNVKWYYNPIELFNLVTYLLFCIMTFLYLIFCLIGSCMCCRTLSKKKGKQTLGTFVDMWLLLPYALVPCIMYGPSFGFTSIGFVMEHLMTWIMNNGLLNGGADMAWALDLMATALNLMPWFVLLFPLVHCTLGVICIKMFREQFFFLITCGRIYQGSNKISSLKPKQWSPRGVTSTPVYPSQDPQPATMEAM